MKISWRQTHIGLTVAAAAAILFLAPGCGSREATQAAPPPSANPQVPTQVVGKPAFHKPGPITAGRMPGNVPN